MRQDSGMDLIHSHPLDNFFLNSEPGLLLIFALASRDDTWVEPLLDVEPDGTEVAVVFSGKDSVGLGLKLVDADLVGSSILKLVSCCFSAFKGDFSPYVFPISAADCLGNFIRDIHCVDIFLLLADLVGSSILTLVV